MAITVKHQKQLTFKPINVLIDSTVSLTKNFIDTIGKDTQNACFSFILSVCAKEISIYITPEFHEKHITHLHKYYQEKLDSKVIPKSFRAQLNENNIGNAGLNTRFELGSSMNVSSHWSITNAKKILVIGDR